MAETVVLPAGTIVKVNGFPFRLPLDTVAEGSANNLALGAVAGPHCRDCADFAQDGICPNSGKPCSTKH